MNRYHSNNNIRKFKNFDQTRTNSKTTLNVQENPYNLESNIMKRHRDSFDQSLLDFSIEKSKTQDNEETEFNFRRAPKKRVVRSVMTKDVPKNSEYCDEPFENSNSNVTKSIVPS